MHRNARRAGLVLTPLLLLGACGPLAQQRTVRLLNDRLQAQLAPSIRSGEVTLQPTLDGARVTLQAATLFPDDKLALDNESADVRANLVEALLDPSLMRIQVADTSTLPDSDRAVRVSNIQTYFTDYGLGQTLLPSEPGASAGGTLPAGLVVSISVQCPRPSWNTGYDGGLSKPVCE